ncbi:ATP-binding protein [Myxococcota bacterium]|nr:ATP-binding protein [Myxococcota bacterium]
MPRDRLARTLAAMGIRGRLFVVSVVLISLVGTVSASWLRLSLREILHDRTAAELTRLAVASRVAVEGLAPSDVVEVLDPLADELGATGDIRVSVIRDDGVVLGDSRLDIDQVRGLERHDNRPEVRRALDEGAAVFEARYSTTLDSEMLYAAVPYQAPGHRGVVRTAIEVRQVDQGLAAFDVAVLAAGLVGLGAAVFMSGLASHLASRDVSAMLARIRDVLARSRTEAIPRPHDDELSMLAGGVQDLADRLRTAVSEVSAERARLEALLSSMSEGVLALDPDCRVRLANPAATALLGLEAPPQDRPLVDVVRAPDLVAVAREALGGEPDAAAEVELPGGRTLLATARPLEDGAGCVLVLHDMTGVRRLERVRRDFVANVSHELRTPVSIIRANAESLADGALEDPAVARTFLAAIQRNAERLGATISDLLDLSRIESGRMDLRRAPTQIRPVVERAVEAVHDRAPRSDRSVAVEVPPELRFLGDPVALEHILVNLLENAVKYTREGGHIWVRARLLPPGEGQEAQVRVEVEDDGPGVPERHRERVFERFYRVDPGRARHQGGTGLGLAIVKNLAEHMGGSVGLDPRQPTGCVFWVRLPAAPRDA